MILETFGVRLSTVEEIEQQSQSVLLDAYGRMADVEPPVDLNRVTRALRLHVKTGTFSDRDLAGYYDKSARTVVETDGHTVASEELCSIITGEAGCHRGLPRQPSSSKSSLIRRACNTGPGSERASNFLALSK